MPSIEQHDWSKLRPSLSEVRSNHHTSPEKLYWRYKKKTSPQIITVFKCSKCKYNAANRKDLDDHWLLEHSK